MVSEFGKSAKNILPELTLIAYPNSGEVFEWDGHYTFDQLKDNPEKATEMNMESFYGKWIGKKVTLGQSKRRQCVKIQRLLHRLCGLKWFFLVSQSSTSSVSNLMENFWFFIFIGFLNYFLSLLLHL